MTTLRASSGKTSSGVIFWLIAVIRKNERSGPGMDTSSADEESLGPDDCGEAEASDPARSPGTGGTALQEFS